MITVATDIQISDLRALSKFIVRRTLVTDAGRIRRIVLPFALGTGMAAGPALFGWILGFTIHWPTMLATIVSTWGSLVVYSRLRSPEMLPQANGIILGPRTVSVDEHAIRVATDHHQSLFALDCVQHVGLGPEHVFVMVDRAAGIIIPRRDFQSPAECDQFLAALRSRPSNCGPGTSAP